MSFELSGKLIEKFDTVKITDTFSKREFVIEKIVTINERDYSDMLKFQLTQDRCEILDSFNLDDEILVRFNIRGRKWEKDDRVGYFTNLEAWKLENVSAQENVTPPPHTEDDIPPETDDDDLPF